MFGENELKVGMRGRHDRGCHLLLKPPLLTEKGAKFLSKSTKRSKELIIRFPNEDGDDASEVSDGSYSAASSAEGARVLAACLVEEREGRSRVESYAQQLQQEYASLLSRYAEAELTIDQLKLSHKGPLEQSIDWSTEPDHADEEETCRESKRMSVLFKAASLEEQMETLQSTGLTLSMGKRRQQTSAMRKALNEMQTEVQDAALQGVTLDTDDSLVTELSNLNQKFEQLLTKLHIKMAAQAEDVVPNQDSPQPITDRGRAGGAPTVAQTTLHPTAGVVLSSSPLQDGRVLSQSSNQHPPHRHSSLNGESALHTTLPGGSTSLPAGVESGDVFADASAGAVAPSCCRRCDSGLTAAAFGEASPSSPRDAGGDLLIRTYLESMENQQNVLNSDSESTLSPAGSSGHAHQGACCTRAEVDSGLGTSESSRGCSWQNRGGTPLSSLGDAVILNKRDIAPRGHQDQICYPVTVTGTDLHSTVNHDPGVRDSMRIRTTGPRRSRSMNGSISLVQNAANVSADSASTEEYHDEMRRVWKEIRGLKRELHRSRSMDRLHASDGHLLAAARPATRERCTQTSPEHDVARVSSAPACIRPAATATPRPHGDPRSYPLAATHAATPRFLSNAGALSRSDGALRGDRRRGHARTLAMTHGEWSQLLTRGTPAAAASQPCAPAYCQAEEGWASSLTPGRQPRPHSLSLRSSNPRPDGCRCDDDAQLPAAVAPSLCAEVFDESAEGRASLCADDDEDDVRCRHVRLAASSNTPCCVTMSCAACDANDRRDDRPGYRGDRAVHDDDHTRCRDDRPGYHGDRAVRDDDHTRCRDDDRASCIDNHMSWHDGQRRVGIALSVGGSEYGTVDNTGGTGGACGGHRQHETHGQVALSHNRPLSAHSLSRGGATSRIQNERGVDCEHASSPDRSVLEGKATTPSRSQPRAETEASAAQGTGDCACAYHSTEHRSEEDCVLASSLSSTLPFSSSSTNSDSSLAPSDHPRMMKTSTPRRHDDGALSPALHFRPASSDETSRLPRTPREGAASAASVIQGAPASLSDRAARGRGVAFPQSCMSSPGPASDAALSSPCSDSSVLAGSGGALSRNGGALAGRGLRRRSLSQSVEDLSSTVDSALDLAQKLQRESQQMVSKLMKQVPR